jgi:hypothetical protein
MTNYDLHVQQVSFQMVPAHHVLQQLTRQFGGELLIDTIKRFEDRDQRVATDPERGFRPGPDQVLQ